MMSSWVDIPSDSRGSPSHEECYKASLEVTIVLISCDLNFYYSEVLVQFTHVNWA